jgi:hypothetical protein
VAVLRILFVGDISTSCEDAADINDDGSMNIADSVYLLTYLFAGGTTPPDPFGATCGYDPTSDGLRCVVFEPCE